MISTRKLIKLARKWQKLANLRSKRISWPRSAGTTTDADPCSRSSTADKGHFVVYSIDSRRFEIPLAYLRNQIVAELLRAAEEEFGLPRDGPITMTCDGVVLEYALSLIPWRMGEDMQKALVISIADDRCSSSYTELVPEQRSHSHTSICSF
ncbi:hypothetical protein Dimus_026146 [Dionaea muscipula]